jgi:hypothetical protein
MPKAGSGFMSAAGRQAGFIQRGAAGSWRLGGGGSAFTREIQELYKSMYRRGLTFRRDSRGRNLEMIGSDEKWLEAGERILELAGKIAADVQIYNQPAAEHYSNLRKMWGKGVYVNAKEMREFRAGMQYGDQMLINPRGRRGIASDASARAEAVGYSHNGGSNADILLHANRQMNATRNAIWQNASRSGIDMTGDINNELIERYEKTERAAWRRRKNK